MTMQEDPNLDEAEIQRRRYNRDIFLNESLENLPPLGDDTWTPIPGGEVKQLWMYGNAHNCKTNRRGYTMSDGTGVEWKIFKASDDVVAGNSNRKISHKGKKLPIRQQPFVILKARRVTAEVARDQLKTQEEPEVEPEVEMSDKKSNYVKVITTEGTFEYYPWDSDRGDRWIVQTTGYLQVHFDGHNSRYSEKFFVGVVEARVVIDESKPDKSWDGFPDLPKMKGGY